MNNNGIYDVPRDINFKSKFIGGMMTIPQLGWLILWAIPACILGGSLYLSFHLIIPSIFIGLIIFAIGGVFAFVKIDGYEFANYLKYASRNSKLPHYLINGGIEEETLDPVFTTQSSSQVSNEESIDVELQKAAKNQKKLTQTKQNLFEKMFTEPNQ